MSRGEIDQRVALFAYLNVNRDVNKHARPFVPSWPWPTEEEAEAAAVSPERRAELLEYLRVHSAFNREIEPEGDHAE